MAKHKDTQSRPKTLYRVKNWSEYDKALTQRGSITIWLSEGFEKNWQYVGERQPGSQFDYSAQAIISMLTVKSVFHLHNRATEGFVHSIFAMIGVKLSVPDHTTLSRRGKGLKIALPKKASGHCHGQHRLEDLWGRRMEGENAWQVQAARR